MGILDNERPVEYSILRRYIFIRSINVSDFKKPSNIITQVVGNEFACKQLTGNQAIIYGK